MRSKRLVAEGDQSMLIVSGTSTSGNIAIGIRTYMLSANVTDIPKRRGMAVEIRLCKGEIEHLDETTSSRGTL